MKFWALLYFWGLVAAYAHDEVLAAGETNLERALEAPALKDSPSICRYYTYTWAVTEGAPFASPLYPSWAEPG